MEGNRAKDTTVDRAELGYGQGWMDCLAYLKSKEKLTQEGLEFGRLVLAEGAHIHYQSIIGAYCVICRTRIEHPYNRWPDGQENVI